MFAVHSEHGTIRLDACGVLMIGPPETVIPRYCGQVASNIKRLLAA